MTKILLQIEIYRLENEELHEVFYFEFKDYFILLRDIAIEYNEDIDYLMVDPHKINCNKLEMINFLFEIPSDFFDNSHYEMFVSSCASDKGDGGIIF